MLALVHMGGMRYCEFCGQKTRLPALLLRNVKFLARKTGMLPGGAQEETWITVQGGPETALGWFYHP